MEYSIIGKYRQELMGIAILNVLVLHSLNWTCFNSPEWLAIALNCFGRLVFTEGFLFLSGYGLYYSFYKNNNLKQFYTKRVKRLLVPYWLMTLPFFVTFLLNGEFGFWGLLSRIFTLEFWINGNYEGMWYIAVSVLLYAIMPLIYGLLQIQHGGVLLLLLTCAIVTAVFFFVPDYYKMTSIGITKLPFFVLGAWVGKQSMEDRRLSVWWFFALIILLIILNIHPVLTWLNDCESVLRIVGIILCCIFLKYTEKFVLLHRLLRWFGSYTLEIYILHLMFESTLTNIVSDGYVKVLIAIGGALLLCVPVHKGCDWAVKKLD